jgi:predicted N-acetyltransferase YhbS
MILVGHPTYYPRFGFRPASTWRIRYATPIRDEVFMAIELMPGGLADAAGVVTLPREFNES